MPSWTGYYIQISGLSDLGDAANSTQSAVSLDGPYLADDGIEDGTPSINGSDVTDSFLIGSSVTFTIAGTDYAAETSSFGWELANGDMFFSPDFSGTNNQAIVDALNASGGVIDSISFGFVSSNSFAEPRESHSLSTSRYGGPICFAAETQIWTPGGARIVETLRRGERVCVRGTSAQPIKWIGKSVFSFQGPRDRHRPILLPQGCLGLQRPVRDLIVSPQHGILLQGSGSEILVPAGWLVGKHGIRVMRGKKAVTYYHLMFQTHQIVISNGIPSESFFPGRIALQMIGGKNRQAIAEAFDMDLDSLVRSYGPRARRRLPAGQADVARQFGALKLVEKQRFKAISRSSIVTGRPKSTRLVTP